MSGDYKSYAELFRAKAAAEDIDDYNNAISGADVGRILKHGASHDIDPITGARSATAQKTPYNAHSTGCCKTMRSMRSHGSKRRNC